MWRARRTRCWSQFHDGADGACHFSGGSRRRSRRTGIPRASTRRTSRCPLGIYRVVHVHGRLQLHDDWEMGAGRRGQADPHARGAHTGRCAPRGRRLENRKDARPTTWKGSSRTSSALKSPSHACKPSSSSANNRSAEDRHAAATSVAAAGHPALGAAMTGRLISVVAARRPPRGGR